MITHSCNQTSFYPNLWQPFLFWRTLLAKIFYHILPIIPFPQPRQRPCSKRQQTISFCNWCCRAMVAFNALLPFLLPPPPTLRPLLLKFPAQHLLVSQVISTYLSIYQPIKSCFLLFESDRVITCVLLEAASFWRLTVLSLWKSKAAEAITWSQRRKTAEGCEFVERIRPT